MTEEKKYILYAKQEQVATLTLNRPESLNALNTALLTELSTALEEADADAAVRVVVITGAGGKAFCAGADVAELLKKTSEEARAFSQWFQGIVIAIESMRKPVIAKINGFCLGGGLELALACDFRIASDKAVFGLPEVNLAIIPGGGGTQRLPRLIGKTKALEMLMTGERIDATEAERLTLVNAIVPAEELDRAVDIFVQMLLTKSPVILAILKEAVNKGLEMDLEQALEYEAECFEDALKTEDAQEGLKAFLEKRKPEFRGK
ncbi:MAG: enoyl-CoA hydratase/isomerase family protein [Methanomicrobia archaeon]|nr:enoyl-CoA hydratase/isomerase family protein [Methanomicrobia archaeon]